MDWRRSSTRSTLRRNTPRLGSNCRTQSPIPAAERKALATQLKADSMSRLKTRMELREDAKAAMRMSRETCHNRGLKKTR